MYKTRFETANIALIEKDPEQGKFLGMSLEHSGYKVRKFQDPLQVLKDASIEDNTLFIIDMGLPQMDGLSFYKAFCENHDKPLTIILSKHKDLEQKILRAGVDDFVTKPFNTEGLIARVDKLSGKNSKSLKRVTERKLGNLYMDYEKWLCKWYDMIIDFTRTEYIMVQLLTTRPGVVYERNQFLDLCYQDINVDYRSIDSMIKRIRKKLRKAHSDTTRHYPIRTHYGTGYSWESSSPGSFA
jgi:DNA-binding response OmpR family regulator